MENPIKMDDVGGNTTICGKTNIYICLYMNGGCSLWFFMESIFSSHMDPMGLKILDMLHE